MREIYSQTAFCSGDNGNNLRNRLDDAISWASGLEQGIPTDSDLYKRGEQHVKDAIADLAAALLGRNIRFEGLIEDHK